MNKVISRKEKKMVGENMDLTKYGKCVDRIVPYYSGMTAYSREREQMATSREGQEWHDSTGSGWRQIIEILGAEWLGLTSRWIAGNIQLHCGVGQGGACFANSLMGRCSRLP